MSGLRPFIISILLLGLLAMAVINAGILIAHDNNSKNSIANDTDINNYASSLQNSLANASETADKTDESFRNSTISTSGGVVFVDAIGGLWTTLIEVPSMIMKLTTNLVKGKILGDTAFYAVIGVISAILVITLILAVWKLVGTGEGG